MNALLSCPECGGSGVIVKRVQVYEAGCGFPHDDGEEVPCPTCCGPDPDYQRDLMIERREMAKEFPDAE